MGRSPLAHTPQGEGRSPASRPKQVQAVVTASDAKAADDPDRYLDSQDHPNLRSSRRRCSSSSHERSSEGFTAEDFKHQLLKMPASIWGRSASSATTFPRLIQNLQESFARTAWDIAAAGRPFGGAHDAAADDATALMSLYVQVKCRTTSHPRSGWAEDAPRLEGRSFRQRHSDHKRSIRTAEFHGLRRPGSDERRDFQLSLPGNGRRQPVQGVLAALSAAHQLHAPLSLRRAAPGGSTRRSYFSTADLTDWRGGHPSSLGGWRHVPGDLPSLRKRASSRSRCRAHRHTAGVLRLGTPTTAISTASPRINVARRSGRGA